MSNMPIFYDPLQELDSVGPGPEGTPVKFVSGEAYFTGMLGFRMNVTLVFLSINTVDQVSPEELLKLDNAIAAAYWKKYEGVLFSPRVRHLLRAASAGPSGSYWLSQIESIKGHMVDADSLEMATDIHAVSRVEMILDGVDHKLSDFQVAAGEFMTDYLLLQRAIMEDVRTAESRRQPGESRAAILELMDRSAELAFEKAVATVHRPQIIAEAIPLVKKAEIEKYSRNREQFYTTGLFAKLESERFGF